MESICVFTPPEKEYARFWMTVRDSWQMIFEVKACDSAFVALSTYTFTTTEAMYEIELTNSRSYIRKAEDGSVVVEGENGAILHCSEFRTFWIEWGDHTHIYIGEGPDVDRHTLLKFEDSNHMIKAVSFSTANSNEGEFHIMYYAGEYTG